MIPKQLPENIPFKIRTSGTMTLILMQETIFGASGGEDGIEYENTSPLNKDKLVEKYLRDPDDCILFLAWTGSYKTDVFLLTEEDIDKHYK